MPEGDRDFLLRAVCGHHGSPPQEDVRDSRFLCDVSRTAAATFCADFLALLKPMPLPFMDEKAVTALAWWLAGLTVLADWVGSSENWFTYPVQAESLAAYWPIARERARQGVAAAGLGCSEASEVSPMTALLGENPPTPLQKLMSEMDLAEKPALIIVEDQTGSGKNRIQGMTGIGSCGVLRARWDEPRSITTSSRIAERSPRTHSTRLIHPGSVDKVRAWQLSPVGKSLPQPL
jgi:HD domain